MPTMTKRARAGEPQGTMTIHTPEEIVRATRSADGGSWIACPDKGTAVRTLTKRGWVFGGSEAKAPGRPLMATKTKTPTPPMRPHRKAAKPATGPCLDVLDGSVSALEADLATGEHDAHLDDLLAAEEAGKTRKGAVRAIKARKIEAC